MSVLAQKTQQVYSNSNKRLAAVLKVEALTPELLADSKKIIELVESITKKDGKPLGHDGRRGYYSALMTLLPKQGELWQIYRAKVQEHSKITGEIAKKQELTEREEGKWLSWEQILAVRDKLKPETPDDFFQYQDWIILCLYTMVPPLRVDYSPMAVVEEVPKDTKGNFLVLSPTKNCFVLQEYKTAGTYGRVEFDIPDELLDVLYEWVVYNPSGWLLLKGDGEPYTDYNLSQRVGRIMEKATRGADGSAGKICGVTMMRHAYKTWLHRGEKPTLVAEAEAKKMLHSASAAQSYRRIDKE